jgi:5-methyltetrahydrofolate--homocysteine methyltransferase
MEHSLRATIQNKIVLMDGGMGSMIIASGMRDGEVPEAWVVSNQEKQIGIHAAYLDAGAEVIQTNTFGASRLKLHSSEAGAGLDPVDVNRKAAGLARKAVEAHGSGGRYVAGDVGPTGLFFPPVGQLDEETAVACFEEQIKTLADAGVDLILIETMYDLREAVAAVKAARKVTDLLVAAELTFEKRPRGYFTMMGDTVEKAVQILEGEGADMLGANCTLTSDDMLGIVGEFRERTSLPLVFQPNAGQPAIERGRAIYRQKPEDFAQDIELIVRAGANAVGGCCGTTPSFIKAVHDRLTHKG